MRRRKPMIVGGLTVLVLGSLAGLASGWFVPTETTITELAPGVFFRKTQTEPKFIGCNQGWVIFKDFVLVIDANFPDQAEEVIRLIRKTTDKPIRYVFDTHYHGDHADGNQKYAALGAATVASEDSRSQFETKGLAGFEKARKDKPAVYGNLDYQKPNLYFPKKLVVDDGTQHVELLHFGHAHTAGDAVAWLPKHGLLFTGDACVNGAFNYTGDGDTASWIRVVSEMQKLPVKTVCPGHGEMADAGVLEKQKRYFVELREAIQRMIDKGRSLAEIKEQLDIPFYKEWTGVEAKTRTENIEFVYKELTGAGKKYAAPSASFSWLFDLGLWTSDLGPFPPMQREEIERLIPHRAPFLWLDEVVELSETAIHARKFLDPKLDVFAGHYPHFPVMPGVLQCEAAFQAEAVLIARRMQPDAEKVPVVTRVNNVKFRRIVVPGETLDIHAELTEQLSSAYFLKARTSVDGKTACTLEFACTLADPRQNIV